MRGKIIKRIKKKCHSLVQDFRASKNSIFRKKNNEKIRRTSNQFGVASGH